MAGRAPARVPFSEILEQGATVDDIFRDSPVPLGSNPFEEKAAEEAVEITSEIATITPLSVEEVKNSYTPPSQNLEIENIGIVDNDSLFCINRKFAALESLFKVVSHEYYPFGQMISEVLRVAMDQVKSEAGSFIEIDHQNNCMFFRAVAGRSSQNLLNFTIPRGQGIVGFVCDNQQPMTLSTIDESSIYLKSISDAVGFETRNLAAYPVVIRGVTFGCIELLNRLGEPQFTDADKEVMTTICDYAGRVIENRLILAHMYNEMQALKSGKKENAA